MLNTDFFHTEMPPRPMGKYAHIVLLRVTEGYALFQTDGELNRAVVSAGASDESAKTTMTRITLFKRKQTTPERLNGREALRNYGILTDESALTTSPIKDDKALSDLADKHNNSQSGQPYACFYNVHSCKRCPDCIAYGFAVGDGGSEKSKVFSDTAFSLTDYAVSHETFTLNALYEDGTMSYRGEATSRINSQDHVKPQVIFPAVITTRDLTASLFFYVLHNVLRTTRYGATTTRGGTMQNHIAAIILSDGEIFSNLLFTQQLHDALNHTGNDPIPVNAALKAAETVIPKLLEQDNVRDDQVWMGSDLNGFLNEIRAMDRSTVENWLQQAARESGVYHGKYIAKAGRK